MTSRHPEQEIFKFITGDFEAAWNGLAGTADSHRGNFLFALLAMILLEWVCRLCSNEANALLDFSKALQQIEPRYFTQLDDGIKSPGFTLPGVGPDPLKNLLSALWDLIRNGNAHEYQDIFVALTDGKHWALRLLGVDHGHSLHVVGEKRSSLRHLTCSFDRDGDLALTVHPGVLFLDIRDAVRNSSLLNRGLVPKPFARPRNQKEYQFSSTQLKEALQKGGFIQVDK